MVVLRVSLLAFSAVSLVALYALQRLQPWLPLSLGHDAVEPALAFNTAASFVTNTNWQAYAGESTMGHLVQMAGLTVQNFVSAAVGIAVAVALDPRGRRTRRRRSGTSGPTSSARSSGCSSRQRRSSRSRWSPSAWCRTSTGSARSPPSPGGVQSIPGGPVASQEAIKELGTNGGGFYNANSAHPFENPNGVTNLLQLFLILAVPFALTGMYGRMVGDRRQGYVLAAVMATLWLGSVLVAWHLEASANPQVIRRRARRRSRGENLEGKEVRFGVPASALFAASTTATSTGAVNASHDSFAALGGGVPLVNIMLSEVTPGGVGSGLYGMLVLAIVAVFIAGLMVGRTPEYVGKRIEPREMKLVSLYLLLVPALILIADRGRDLAPSARASILNPGPHGLSEVLYAFTSGANNNGSAFAGLAADTPFYDAALGAVMLLGRFGSIVLVLGLAGALARKQRFRRRPARSRRRRRCSPSCSAASSSIVTALTYFPALALGPLAEGLT